LFCCFFQQPHVGHDLVQQFLDEAAQEMLMTQKANEIVLEQTILHSVAQDLTSGEQYFVSVDVVQTLEKLSAADLLPFSDVDPDFPSGGVPAVPHLHYVYGHQPPSNVVALDLLPSGVSPDLLVNDVLG
jgi:hypothetical protein